MLAVDIAVSRRLYRNIQKFWCYAIAMGKKSKLAQKQRDQAGRNVLIWLVVSFASWAVYVLNGGTIFGLWADMTLVVVAVWIFRYVWQSLKPSKGWNVSSIKTGLIAVLLYLLWLGVVGVLYAVLPKSAYFG